MGNRAFRISILVFVLPLMAACSNDQPREADIIEALESAHFMAEKITADRVSSISCAPVEKLHECVIAYRAQKKRAASEVGIDKIGKIRLQIELVGKRWRVSKIVLT